MTTQLDPYVPRLLPGWAALEPGLVSRAAQGTLVFFDISGFTRLTERLAGRGRAGAEELSDILDEIFGPLVEIALGEGCDLLKWGGDAVLLFAEGPGAPARGARAAVLMRTALGRLGHLRTSVGRVVLRASTAVVTGEVTFVLAGDPEIHRELMVLGHAATAVALLEAEASAGQVLVDADTARKLPRELLGEQVGLGRLLLGLPPAGQPLGLLATEGHCLDHVGHLLPPQLRVHLEQGAHEPEHRVATAAFIRFAGTDALFDGDGLGAVTTAVDELVRNVQDATRRHGVSFHESDIDVDGGKIMLVAGAPLSSGDDADHMLATVRLIVDRAGVIPVRAGVAQGRVFVGHLGPPARRTYSVKGGAVNLAARLAARAVSGQIRLPSEVLDHSRVRWETSDPSALQLKGISKPVPTVALGSARSGPSVSSDTVMVGRERELGQIGRALDQLGALQGGSIVIYGEPGMGKTRLVAEVVSEADDFPLLMARCGHSGAAAPYATVRTLLAAALGLDSSVDPVQGLEKARDLLTALAPELLDHLSMLGAVFDVALPGSAEVVAVGDEFRTEALHRLVVDIFRATLLGPTVLVIEDTHLMDRDSGRVLDQLFGRAKDRPWLLLTTRRDAPEGWTAQAAEPIRLVPLDGDASMSMAELVDPEHPLPPAVARHLAVRAGGHPLFLRELVLAASRGERLDDLPLSVEELVTVQIDSLPAAPRALLRRAAVLGDTFTPALLREVASDDGNLPSEVALREQLLRLASFIELSAGRRLRFRHTVHRETAYAGLPVKVRARLHAHVGDVLARSPRNLTHQPEVLAHHFFAAGRFEDAWGFARKAGHKALDRAAPEAAAEAFARAAESAARAASVGIAEQATDLESWGDALFLCGRSGDADRAYAHARRLQGAVPLRLADLSLKLAKVAQRQGRYAVALRRTTAGLRDVADLRDDDALAARARLLARRSVVQTSQGRYREAGQCAEQAVRIAQRAGQQDSLAQAHLVLHTVEVFTGTHSGVDHGATALALYESLGDLAGQAHAQNNIALRLLLMGDWPQALDRFSLAAASFEKVGDAANAANAAYNSADLLNRQGRAPEALALLARVARVALAVDDEELSALVLREQGRARTRSGEAGSGMALLLSARQHFETLHEPHEVCDTDIAIAESHLLDGRAHEALEVVDGAIAAAQRLGAATLLPSALRVRASALVELGDAEGARESLEQGLAAGAEAELAHERGFLLAVAARLGDLEAAKEATAALDRLGVVRAPLPWASAPVRGGLP